VDAALADGPVRHRQRRALGRAVAVAPAEEGHLEADALVQGRERRDAIGRRVTGDEQDRPPAQATASS